MFASFYRVLMVFVLAMVVGGLPALVVAQVPQESVPDSVLDTALWSIGLTQADLSIRGDTLGDPDRFGVTKNILETPAMATDLLPKFGIVTGKHVLQDALQLYGETSSAWPVLSDHKNANGLDTLIQALIVCQKRLDEVYEHFSKTELDAFLSLILLADPKVSVSEMQADTLMALGRRVNCKALLVSVIALMDVIDAFVALPPKLESGVFDTPVGRVIVGTDSSDVYTESAVLIVDLGGNDRYTHLSKPGCLSVVIDLGGDDLHEGMSGSGIAGVQVVVDVWGQDRYQSDGVGQGVGIGGVGVLVDLAGDDVYQADVGGQGFGFYGVGVLCDRAGADQYEGALLVQGVGAPGGIGILADQSGDDIYQAGGKYRDFREDGQFYQSMAQGFGYGIRPLASGGVGVLIDQMGDDRYEVGYFGQGCGFWGSVGIVLDGNGNDQYVARRYAQGCGVHLAVGLLVDEMGNDVYALWGVGQGCGHDLALGRLVDAAGADHYRATWLAQGVGSANGVGWLDDGAGDDVYWTERDDTQGFGMQARDYGSIGILIDRAGLDQYRESREDGFVRSVGDYGVRVDWPLFWRYK